MATLQERIDALEEAAASGEKSVSLPGGESVTYRSVAEIEQVLDRLKAQLQATAGGRTSRSSLAYFRRGL